MSKFEDNDLPRLHIMQQLQRAKLSLFGGIEVGFRDGSERFVTANEAHLFIDHYYDMKPWEKEEFQGRICASRDAFCNELHKLNKYNNKTGDLTNGSMGQQRQRSKLSSMGSCST